MNSKTKPKKLREAMTTQNPPDGGVTEQTGGRKDQEENEDKGLVVRKKR